MLNRAEKSGPVALAFFRGVIYSKFYAEVVFPFRTIGLSPSGKAKDFDSFIPPVRIRSALFLCPDEAKKEKINFWLTFCFRKDIIHSLL